MHTDKRSSTCVFKHPLRLLFDSNSCVQLVKIQKLAYPRTHSRTLCVSKNSKIFHTNILFRENSLPLFQTNATYTVIKIQDYPTCTISCVDYECTTKDVLLYFRYILLHLWKLLCVTSKDEAMMPEQMLSYRYICLPSWNWVCNTRKWKIYKAV